MTLKIHGGRHSSPPSAPTAEFDPAGPYRHIDALALLVWPGDERRREEFFATGDAYLLDFGRSDASAALLHGFEEVTRSIADHNGITVAEVRADSFFGPMLAELEKRFGAAQSRANVAVVRRMFEPVGRFSAVADAPGWDAFGKEISRTITDHGRRTGLALLAVMSLNTHHPRYKPSLNRACAAVARTSQEHAGGGVVEADAVKKSWSRLRAVAPFWAGMVAEVEASAALLSPGDFEEAFMAVLLDPERLQRALRYAVAVRQFATTHKAGNAPSEEALLPPLDAFEYRVGLAPLYPPVHPLTGEALAEAEDYQPHETPQERAKRRRGR